MYKSDYSCIFEKWFSFNVKHLKTIRFFPHIQALLRSILSMYKLVNVWVTWDRQVLAFPLNAAALWAQLCCPAISKLLFFLSAIKAIDLAAALMENNIDREHFLGMWGEELSHSQHFCPGSHPVMGLDVSALPQLRLRMCWALGQLCHCSGGENPLAGVSQKDQN